MGQSCVCSVALKKRLINMRKSAHRHIENVTWLRVKDQYLCPCCARLHDLDDMDQHHVHPVGDGGHGYHWNVLGICRTCHVAIGAGSKADAAYLDGICQNFMLARYGLLFGLQVKSARAIVRDSVKPDSTLGYLKWLSQRWKFYATVTLNEKLLERLPADKVDLILPHAKHVRTPEAISKRGRVAMRSPV